MTTKPYRLRPSLLPVIGPYSYTLLEIILLIRNSQIRATTENEPEIVLKQNYLTGQTGFSSPTIVKTIRDLSERKIIHPIPQKKGACTHYQFDPIEYVRLVRHSQSVKHTIVTGRKKTIQKVTYSQILDYHTGKSYLVNHQPNKHTCS